MQNLCGKGSGKGQGGVFTIPLLETLLVVLYLTIVTSSVSFPSEISSIFYKEIEKFLGKLYFSTVNLTSFAEFLTMKKTKKSIGY
jgi:hypothetical protein